MSFLSLAIKLTQLLPLSGVPSSITYELSRMSINAHVALQDEVWSIHHTKRQHHPKSREFASDNIGAEKCYNQSHNDNDEEPFSEGIAEPDELDEFENVAGPAVDNKAEDQAGVLRHEVVGQLAEEQQ